MGSEMCIRDRPAAAECPQAGAGEEAGKSSAAAVAISAPCGAAKLAQPLATPTQPPVIRVHTTSDYVWIDERLHFADEQALRKLDQAEIFLAHVKARARRRAHAIQAPRP